MKINSLFRLAFLIFFSISSSDLTAQVPSEKIKNEIGEALTAWNNAGKNAKTDEVMKLFDNTGNIMVIGSDSGEICKGRDQVAGWLNRIFKHNSFSWEMNRIDIDCNGSTAWVFVDGNMVVANDKGKTMKTPYRFTGILVKKGKEWKWRLFDGSVPHPE
jgi:ketosteroid isomerase-like protein